MPKHPRVSDTTTTLSTRVFSQLAARAAAKREAGEPVFALSVGDTYRSPHPSARAEAQREDEHPGLHQYAPVQGIPTLLDAIGARLSAIGRPVPAEHIQVMSGATAGLSVVIGTLFDPGDEVILPSPFWPLIRGIIASRGAVPVQVPFYDRLDAIDVEKTLEAAVTSKTVALYVNTPHNPTGVVLDDPVIDAMVRVCERHDLWLLTDEAYQDLWFTETRPSPVWARDDVQGRYVASHTLSKSYGLAGARIGYTHGSAEVMQAIRGVQTFATYCAPRPMQHAGAMALREAGSWLEEARREYAEAGAKAAAVLGIPAPRGGTFVLFDASRYFRDGEEDAMGFLGRCLDAGVLLTPGASCGQDYASWVRLCFTSVGPKDFDEALERLKSVL